MIGHRVMGATLLLHGGLCGKSSASMIARLRFTILSSIVALATRFGQDAGVAILAFGRGPCGFLAIPRPR